MIEMKLILDVRNREEFLKRHVKNAINISVFDLKYFLDILKNHEIIVYCNSGRKTRIAVTVLRRNGINVTAKSISDFKENEFVKNKELVTVIFDVKVNSEVVYDFEVLVSEFYGAAMETEGYLGGNFLRKIEENKNVEYLIITLWENLRKYENVKTKLNKLLKELEKEKIIEEIYEKIYEPLR